MADRLLLLYAVSKGNANGEMDGTFKLMKIPFMAELNSTRSGINTFSYSFYRWTFGPFTTEIYEDADALSALGLCTAKESQPCVTAKGERLLANTVELFDSNSSSVDFVNAAAIKYAPLSFAALKDSVYKEIVSVNGKYKTTIAKAPKGSSVAKPIPIATESFTFDDDWIDTLWGQFNYSDEDLASIARIQPMTSIFEHAYQ